jgi:hypothetical protein
MYTVDEKDRVVELDSVPQSDVGSPQPAVFSNEDRVLISYYIQNLEWKDYNLEQEPIAVINFLSPCAHMFGPPNDEAFSGHPLANRGLHPYGAFIVENSSWVRQLERMNSEHPMHNPESYARYHHFIFAFHDSMFECIAKSFETSVYKTSPKEVYAKMVSMLD